MDALNQTRVTQFVFLGLTDNWVLEILLFMAFSVMYVLTLLGTILIMVTIVFTPCLHIPMYFFLSNLSFCNICYSSTISPKMLADFLSEQKRIPYDVCAIQMYFFGAFRDVECLMLAVMA